MKHGWLDIVFGAVVMLMLFFSCGKDEEMGRNQEVSIDNYLSSSPYLTDLPQDSLGSGVWRVLENPREGREEVTADEVEFLFEGYVWSNNLNLNPSLPQRPAPFYTNNPVLVDLLGSGWDTEPWTGTGDLMKGLQRGMDGACGGDSILIFMTSDAGYGGKEIGLVPPDAPLVFRIIIDNAL